MAQLNAHISKLNKTLSIEGDKYWTDFFGKVMDAVESIQLGKGQFVKNPYVKGPSGSWT
jgi:hypothetical protein